ncbi:unnamed protein product [Polarella glacialis]|uniref:RRM domain-containing protein n=1 Tax=Polarella glacialis TaxID=89957 RepID=A0A813D8W1_POLGL|nr:unnamed protein product [Polarella glacialis]CAE8649742.1 unnamed protein product [Polarella glacialis]|mmetsp:Transcript_890/g.1398  ORF Transcript_890/g.1398 Transcript_890/m.1398 type:complete len:155 (+) Transcript_890:45-509(+)
MMPSACSQQQRLKKPEAALDCKPAKSKEGWGIFITGICEEAQEDDLEEAFGVFGEVLGLQLPLDRMTGFVKGYCMLEYKERAEAESAIAKMHGQELRGKAVSVSWLCQEATTRGNQGKSTQTLEGKQEGSVSSGAGDDSGHDSSDKRDRSRSPR